MESTPAPIEPVAPKKGFSLWSVVSVVTGALTYLLILFHSPLKMNFIVAAFILGPISSLAAVISGHKSKHQIRHAEGEMSGKKLANTGLVLGYIYLGFCLLLVVLLIVGATSFISNIGQIFG